MQTTEDDPVHPSKYRVLLLCSYCDENPSCSDDYPCDDCLKMDNVVIVSGDAVRQGENLGGMEYNKRNRR